jgi:hypothetical protein
MNIYFGITIIVLVILLVLQVCQIETYKDYARDCNIEHFENDDEAKFVPLKSSEINTNIDTSILSSEDPALALNIIPTGMELNNNDNNNEVNYNLNEAELMKMKLLSEISNKLEIINKRMNRFDNLKPIQSNTYRNLFETDLPDYINKNREGANKNRIIYDISQITQNNRLNRLEDKLGKLNDFYRKEIESVEKNENDLGSITSHGDGKNLNLIKRGDYYSIPINNGCLFVVDDKTGEVDYDITNISRNDKNKVCIEGNPQQQFTADKVSNIDSYKKIVGSSLLDGPVSGEDVEYPFYVLRPRKFEKLCLQSEIDGITLKPCDFNKSQRWGGFQSNKQCEC